MPTSETLSDPPVPPPATTPVPADIARATLDLNNQDAWRVILSRLLEAGVPDAEAQARRNLVWAERKRLRAAIRAERSATKGT